MEGKEGVGPQRVAAGPGAAQKSRLADLTVTRPAGDRARSGYANRTGGTDQFDVIILSDGRTITAGDVSPASVPDSLRSRSRPGTTC